MGSHASGLYANDDALAEQLLAAGNETHDRAWRMPLWEDYNKQIESNFADLANVGGPEGGSITAACFLAQFAEKQPELYEWVLAELVEVANDPSILGSGFHIIHIGRKP